MSQSATFYPVDSNDFSAIERSGNNLDLLADRENYVCFAGTHEGLRFVLSKSLNNQQVDMVNQIFYPTVCLGETSQYVFPDAEEEHEFIDVTDDENYDDFDREPVFYHNPEKVKQIASLLNGISEEQFSKQFDPEELNRENIYPWCWNNNKEDRQIYNERHILEDYQNLKQLFNNASVTNSYLLCFVG